MLEFLNNIPKRPTKPRSNGLTMIMDKGLSLNEAENMIVLKSELTDIVKLGFGTSLLTRYIDKKIDLYKGAGIDVYVGGTLFEAFLIRDQFDDYVDVLKKYNLKYAEVSDGSIDIPHKKKCEYIEKLANHVTVFSEIGSKDEKKIIPPVTV